MEYEISLLHASFRSKNQGKLVREAWLEAAENPDSIEHCLAFEESDMEVIQEFEIDLAKPMFSKDGKSKCISTFPGSDSSAIRNWNAAASIASGKILFLIADDTIPLRGWDKEVTKIFSALDNCRPYFLKISDNRCTLQREKDGLLPRHPVLNRKMYEQLGWVFNPKFSGGGADDELLIIGIRDNCLVDARQLRIHHSYGNLFDSNGQLNCGCNGVKTSLNRSVSQRLIQIHRRTLGEVVEEFGPSWKVLVQIASNPKWSDLIYEARNSIAQSHVSGLRLFLRLFQDIGRKRNRKYIKPILQSLRFHKVANLLLKK